MECNFDEVINRQNTDSIKYDLRKAMFGRDNVIPMWVADMDFKTPDFIINAIKKRLDHPVLGYTLKPSGLDEAIEKWLYQQHQWAIRKGWIVLSPGVVPSMAIMIYAFSDPGDEIIVQQPVYFPFFRTIEGNNRVLINNPLIIKNGKYEMDLVDLKKKITPRTKMIFLCSPHNPGGRVWKRDELQELCSICIENDLLIVSDEIHSDLVLFGNKHIPTASLSQEVARNSLTLLAASKTFNTAGLNTSYVIISNPALRKRYKDKLADFHLNIGNVPGLIALESAYRKGKYWLDQLLYYLEGNIDFLTGYIEEHIADIKVMRPEGTYLVWLDFRGTNIHYEKITKFLINEAGLGLSDGKLFGEEGNGFQRLNIACPRSVLKQGLDNLKLAYFNSTDEAK
jgi:cystathionine beta-lyase